MLDEVSHLLWLGGPGASCGPGVAFCNEVLRSVHPATSVFVKLFSFGCKEQHVVTEPPDFQDSVRFHDRSTCSPASFSNVAVRKVGRVS